LFIFELDTTYTLYSLPVFLRALNPSTVPPSFFHPFSSSPTPLYRTMHMLYSSVTFSYGFKYDIGPLSPQSKSTNLRLISDPSSPRFFALPPFPLLLLSPLSFLVDTLRRLVVSTPHLSPHFPRSEIRVRLSQHPPVAGASVLFCVVTFPSLSDASRPSPKSVHPALCFAEFFCSVLSPPPLRPRPPTTRSPFNSRYIFSIQCVRRSSLAPFLFIVSSPPPSVCFVN